MTKVLTTYSLTSKNFPIPTGSETARLIIETVSPWILVMVSWALVENCVLRITHAHYTSATQISSITAASNPANPFTVGLEITGGYLPLIKPVPIAHCWYDDPSRPSHWQHMEVGSHALPWPQQQRYDVRVLVPPQPYKLPATIRIRNSNNLYPHRPDMAGEPPSLPEPLYRALESNSCVSGVTYPAEPGSAIILKPSRNYDRLFTELGKPASRLVPDQYGHFTLKNSRGVLLDPIPCQSTLSTICANIRGGALERVEIRNLQNRTCVCIFFIAAEDAIRFIMFSRAYGGVYWGGTGIFSDVQPIQRHQGGHQIVKQNVAKGIMSGATRCILVISVPEIFTAEMIEHLVKTQSGNATVEAREIEFMGCGARCMIVTMGAIETAMGAKRLLESDKRFRGCSFDFVRDPCEGKLEELAVKWMSQKQEDQSAGS
jgi:hypothetical protein